MEKDSGNTAFKMSEKLKFSTKSSLLYNLEGMMIVVGFNPQRFCEYNVKLDTTCMKKEENEMDLFFQTRQDVRQVLGVGDTKYVECSKMVYY